MVLLFVWVVGVGVGVAFPSGMASRGLAIPCWTHGWPLSTPQGSIHPACSLTLPLPPPTHTPQAYQHYLSHIYSIAPIGFGLSLLRWTDANLFLVLYGAVAYYFSNKMARLIILLGPVASALGGAAIGAAFDQLILRSIQRATGGVVGVTVEEETEAPAGESAKVRRRKEAVKHKTDGLDRAKAVADMTVRTVDKVRGAHVCHGGLERPSPRHPLLPLYRFTTTTFSLAVRLALRPPPPPTHPQPCLLRTRFTTTPSRWPSGWRSACGSCTPPCRRRSTFTTTPTSWPRACRSRRSCSRPSCIMGRR